MGSIKAYFTYVPGNPGYVSLSNLAAVFFLLARLVTIFVCNTNTQVWWVYVDQQLIISVTT